MAHLTYDPFGTLADFLKAVDEGRRNITYDWSDIEHYLGKVDREAELKSVMADIRASLERSFKGAYVLIDDPITDGDKIIINQHLTDLGRKAYDHLSRGWFWSKDTDDVDFPATEQWINDMIKKGVMEARVLELFASNTDPRFTELRNKVIYYKLKAKRVGDLYRPLEVGDV